MMRTYNFYGSTPVDLGWEHWIPVDELCWSYPDIAEYLIIRELVTGIEQDHLRHAPHWFSIPNFYGFTEFGYIFQFENGGDSWIVSTVKLGLEDAEFCFSWDLQGDITIDETYYAAQDFLRNLTIDRQMCDSYYSQRPY